MGAMKKTLHLVLGLVTSLFLSVGLVRAAEYSASFDGAKWTSAKACVDGAAPACSQSCSW